MLQTVSSGVILLLMEWRSPRWERKGRNPLPSPAPRDVRGNGAEALLSTKKQRASDLPAGGREGKNKMSSRPGSPGAQQTANPSRSPALNRLQQGLD